MINKIKPLLVLFAIIWLVFIVDFILPVDLTRFGVIPRKISGLIGIVTMPFLHANLYHILSNSLPFLLLGSALFYFYPGEAMKVFVLATLMTGLLVWIFARSSCGVGGAACVHVGASGIIYSFATYLVFAGFYCKKIWGIIISFLVIIFYGGLIWGLLPGRFYISWEGHLAGAIAGFTLAYFNYKKK